jgi:hypothetical protein
VGQLLLRKSGSGKSQNNKSRKVQIAISAPTRRAWERDGPGLATTHPRLTGVMTN